MRTVLALAAALALAPAADAARSACSLLTEAEASKALGIATGPGTRARGNLFDSCTYAHRGKSVVVLRRAISRGGYTQAVRAIPGTSLNAADVSPTAWVYFVKNGIAMTFWRNGTQGTLKVLGAGDGSSTVVRALAPTVLARL